MKSLNLKKKIVLKQIPKKKVDLERNEEVKTPTTVTPLATETEPLKEDSVKPSSAFNAGKSSQLEVNPEAVQKAVTVFYNMR